MRIILLLLMVVWLEGCKREHSGGNLMEKIHAAGMENLDSVQSNPPPDFEWEKIAELAIFDAHRNDTFYVSSAKQRLNRFPCSECHDKGKEPNPPHSGGRAHWEIKMNHAGSHTMDCKTCHDTEGDLHQLKLLESGTVSLDHGHQVCSQCHFQQVKDWQGGAHGKRLSGWAYPRVIKSCAQCHDPHAPAQEKRWPSINPTTHAGKGGHE